MTHALDAGLANAPPAETSAVHGRGGRARGTREQKMFALMLVGAAAGLYVVYRLVRR